MYSLIKRGVIHYASQTDKQTGKRRGVDRDNEGQVKRARKDFDQNIAASSVLE